MAVIMFPCFKELPAELRALIWGFATALESPRVVEVRFGEDPKSRKHDFVADIPTVLHTCQEARFEGLKVSNSEMRKDEEGANGGLSGV
jgi:hypothetical protein